MNKFFGIILSVLPVIALSSPGVYADNPFNAGRTSGRHSNNTTGNTARSNTFNQGRVNNFNDYRVNLNAEYARQIKEYEWRQQQLQKGVTPPDRDIKPVSPQPWDGKEDKNDREIAIDEVIQPIKGGSKAKPIAPVVIQDGEDNTNPNLNINFLGTSIKLHAPASKFHIGGTSQSAIADAWTRLSQADYAPLVADCMKFKQQLSLCDWAYMTFLEAVGKAASADSNSAATLMTYLAAQSGYTVRLAESAEGSLDMLFATQHLLLNRPYLSQDGVDFYPYATKSKSYNVSQSRFNSEAKLSLWIPQLPKAESCISSPRKISSKRYGEFSVTSTVNRNLIDFYSTYPTSVVGSNPVSRWAMYANSPISEHVRANLYPQLRKLIAGKSPLEAVQRLLNWIQTGLVYEYDDKVWGGDRAFFPEESLYYPYCDCEDRSILLTRIVRDLLGLKCLLVFYPGHLAAAIAFPDAVNGDYIMHAGKRFTIADPTYINAPVGDTMPDMDNSTAKVIMLD